MDTGVRQVRAELRKFFTTRMWWGVAIGVFICGAGLAVLFALLAGQGDPQQGGLPDLDTPNMVNTVYTSGLTFAYLLTLTVGVLTIGSEYRHMTITSTFLATPRRVTVMLAKVASLLVIGVLYGLVFLLGAVSAGAIVISTRGFAPFPDTGIPRTLALSLLVLGLWALMGLGAGILIPNQVAAILIAVGVAWIVEPVAALLLGLADWGRDVAKFLPSQATAAMVSQVTTGETVRLTWWGGALALAAYAVVLAGIGSWLTVRRDVS
ncbi:MAG TPA: ABC transporter permease [Dermatophilaceae bacterium]|nr:ABC transporter permease [Dermatophilaceae bacterium]